MYKFKYIWIHIIIIWNQIWNDYMNSYTHEFTYEMNIMNSCTWILMYRFWIHTWIHKYMNSDIRIHCIQSEFMDLISLLWIHNMNWLLKYDENSSSWIHDIEFNSEIRHMDWLQWIQKNQNSDFCYEFIYELNIYEFTNLISWENLWFRIKEHSAAAQSNQPKHLKGNVSLILQPRFQLQWESADTAAASARPMSWINLETNKF